VRRFVQRLMSVRPDYVWRTAVALFFALTLAFVVWGSLAPAEQVGGGRWDKLQHLAAYALLTGLGSLLAPRRLLMVVVAALLLGAGLELLQVVLPLGRTGSLSDWAADAAGVGAAWAVARVAAPGK
jgi:VanZ family protein